MKSSYIFTLLWLMLACATSATAAVRVEASVAKATMILGEANTYTITIQDAAESPSISSPRVDGLTFSTTPSTQQSVRIINGASSSQRSLSWDFRAVKIGRHVIPSQQFKIDGKTFTTDEVTVIVTEMPEELQDRFWLQWKLPEGPFYVGQTIPATLQLYVRGDINAGLGSQPQGSNEQFISAGFDGEPRQRQLRIDQQTYVVVEWETTITPIRAGPGHLPASLTLVYETDQMRRGFFGAQRVQDQIHLTTDNNDWQILDLPLANRPASFSGAVGNFNVSASLSRKKLAVGDPITLSLEIRGEGNFDRIQAPDLNDVDGWRTYPPRADMQAGETALNGVKIFEYILSPTTAEVTNAPDLAFSWFDPSAAEWRETHLPGEAVQVTENPGDGGAIPTPGIAQETDVDPANPPQDEMITLAPIASSIGAPQTLLAPWDQPLFWVVNGGFTCLLGLSLFGILRSRGVDGRPSARARAQTLRQIREIGKRATAAAERSEAPAFYTEARNALRHGLASRTPESCHPQSLTADDLDRFVQEGWVSADIAAEIRELFARKDTLDFGGWIPTPEDLARDRQRFESLFPHLLTHKS